MARFDHASIQRYYDERTPAFARFGQGGRTGALRRAVWGPGVTDRDQAFHFVDHQIAELVRALGSPADLHIVDLGCGVGGSLEYLATRLPVRATGFTLSPVQARLARARFERAGLAPRVTCHLGDYCDLPAGAGPADVAFAIESFAHGPDPARFFAECRDLLRPGGLLVICDDVRLHARGEDVERAVERFIAGWRINALLTPATMVELARATGFDLVGTDDLSGYLELNRPRDRALRVALRWVGWLPVFRTGRFAHLAGGDALQTCLRQGWIGYHLMVFRRGPRAGDVPVEAPTDGAGPSASGC
jgi:SAM-dependent methyltransferase